MNTLEQRRYCGIMQNHIQNIFGVFASATNAGHCLFVKQADFMKIKGLPLVNTGKGLYIINVNKTNLKKLGLI